MKDLHSGGVWARSESGCFYRLGKYLQVMVRIFLLKDYKPPNREVRVHPSNWLSDSDCRLGQLLFYMVEDLDHKLTEAVWRK